MNALAAYIAVLHQQDLLDEAELRRQVKLVRGSQPRVPAWRRGLGSGARGLSGVLASAARSLDPSVEAERSNHRAADGSRAFAG
jgi:hypothetical protein